MMEYDGVPEIYLLSCFLIFLWHPRQAMVFGYIQYIYEREIYDVEFHPRVGFDASDLWVAWKL